MRSSYNIGVEKIATSRENETEQGAYSLNAQ